MSFNTLEEKLETRAKAILDADSTFAGYSITVSKGEDDDELSLPRCLVICEGGEESIPGLGNFNCELIIRLVESMDDTTLANHQTHVATVRDLFMDTNIASTLSDATEKVTVFAAKSFNIAKTVEDRNWVCDLSIDVLAAASDLVSTGHSDLRAALSTIIKTVSSTGTPEVLGTDSTLFHSITFQGMKAARTLNAGNVYIQPASGNDTAGYRLEPGASITFQAGQEDNHFAADQFYIDVETAGDGVVAIHSL